MRVAVLGGGLLGVCTALELARRGVLVDLFDQHARLLDGAATRNEGKIHLGYVYANAGFETAATMVWGAQRFWPLMRRWLGDAVEQVPVSDGFAYLVHRDSLLSPEQVLAHARRVQSLLTTYGPTLDYPGGPPTEVRQLTRSAAAMHFDERWVAAVIQTAERSIAVGALATLLRAAVAAEPRIHLRLRTHVTDAAMAKHGITISAETEGTCGSQTYPQVVNAMWDGRLTLDRRVGLGLDLDPLWRLKYGITLSAPRSFATPSFTAVLGPFGDLVNFGNGQLYLSWYPACLGGLSGNRTPPAWRHEPDPPQARAIVERSIAGLGRLAPGILGIDGADALVRGGVIYARGTTDIDDPASGLHRRDRVGITSCRGWHSVDPGKYTLAPAFAHDVAGRIRPLE